MLVGLGKFTGKIWTFASRISALTSRIRTFTENSLAGVGFGLDIITCEIR